MKAAWHLLFPLLALSTSADVNFKEGAHGKMDAVLVDCTYDQSGTKKVLNATFSYYVDIKGTIITYIETTNLKQTKPATITKANIGGGGVGQGWVTLNIENEKGQGAKFRLQVYGVSPHGEMQNPYFGNCLSPN